MASVKTTKAKGEGLLDKVKAVAKGLAGGVLLAGKRKLEAEPTRIGVGVATGVNALITKVGKGKGLTDSQVNTLGVIVNLIAAEGIRASVTPAGKAKK